MPRGRRPNTRGLIAAARPMPTVGKASGMPATAVPPRQEWQADAWAYFDAIPEVKHGIRFVGNAMAKLRLYPAVQNPDDPSGPPIPVTDAASGVPTNVAAVAVAELGRLRSTRGGQSEILRVLAMNLEVAGEAWIVGFAPQTIPGATPSDLPTEVPERWEVHSVSEVEPAGKNRKAAKVKSAPSDSKAVELGEADTLIRIWQRHPQWAELPDCALAGLLIDCEALHTLSLLGIGDANSKRNNGFLLVPNEITFGSDSSEDGDEEQDPDEDPVFTALAETVQGPIADPASPSSAQPTLVRGPAEALREFRHVLATRPAGDSIEARMEARVRRIARGMDLPVEVTEGHMNTTFANAAQVDQDTFDDYLQPRAEMMVEGLSYGFLGPNLAENRAAAEWADRIFVWYDAADLVTKPRPADTADGAHDRLTISDEAYRRAKGYTEDDAPDEEEVARRIPRAASGVDRVAQLLRGDLPRTIPASAVELPPPRPVALTAGRSVRARTSAGALLLGIDRDLRARLIGAADAAMARAMERAGNRLRSKAQKIGLADTLRAVPAATVAATLGPAIVASLAGDDDLLDGAWDELERQFRTWGAASQQEALEVASAVAAGFGLADRDHLRLRQADDLDEAWKWMRGSLSAVAGERLFSPGGAASTLGEFDPMSSVPTGLVRQALQRAGGATGLITSGQDAWVALYPDGSPAGMIGTGELVGTALADAGVGVEGFVWVYGPGVRKTPFDPHLDLDGTEFVNFDDPVLANSAGWPDDAYYFPGDHAGCLCDFEPVIVTPETGPGGSVSTSDDADAATVAPEVERRLTPSERLAAVAADAGVPLDDLKRAARDLDDIKAAVRSEAKAIQAQVAADLDGLGVGLGRFPRPPVDWKSSGEWDWYRDLDAGQRASAQRWFAPVASRSGVAPTTLDGTLAYVQAADQRFVDMGTNEFGTWWWRQVQLYSDAGTVAQGRLPLAFDPDRFSPILQEAGLNMSRIMGPVDRADAALEVLRAGADIDARDAALRSDRAFQLLGTSHYSEAPPWTMSYQSWQAEVLDLDYIRETGTLTAEQASRLQELIPADLDLPGLGLEDLYGLIVETARTAQMEVADHAVIPWLR